MPAGAGPISHNQAAASAGQPEGFQPGSKSAALLPDEDSLAGAQRQSADGAPLTVVLGVAAGVLGVGEAAGSVGVGAVLGVDEVTLGVG